METGKKPDFSEMVKSFWKHQAKEYSPSGIAVRNKLNLYILDLQKKLKEFNNDYKVIQQYLLSEKARVEEEKMYAVLMKKLNDNTFFEEVIKVIDLSLGFYKEKSENHYVEKEDREPANDNSDDVEPKSSEVELVGKEIAAMPPLDFVQINCNASKAQILKFFMILSKAKNPTKNGPLMTALDVKEMVENNFSIFGVRGIRKYYPINLTRKQKGILRYFMCQFYDKYGVTGDKNKYADFLKYNFEIFESDNHILSNMSESKKPVEHHIIDIEKYL